MPYPTLQTLRELAFSDKTWAKAQDIASTDAIRILSVEEGRVLAEAYGTRRYALLLKAEAGEWKPQCSCPAFSDFPGWCKHLLALGLLLHNGKGNSAGKGSGKKARAPLRVLEEYLQGQDAGTLAGILLSLAEKDTGLFHRLLLRAQCEGGAEALPDAMETVTRIVHIEDFVEWNQASAYAQGLTDLADTLEALHKAGQAQHARALAKQALAVWDEVQNCIDDSGGYTTEPIERLIALIHSPLAWGLRSNRR